MVGVYACSLLTVFLRVQLSVLGGRMFLDLHRTHEVSVLLSYHQLTSQIMSLPQFSGGMSTPVEVQKQYLAAVQYLLQEGVPVPVCVCVCCDGVVLFQVWCR